MSSDSPAAILFDTNGVEIAVDDGATTPAGTRAVTVAGTDGTNSRHIRVDTAGNTKVVGTGTAGSPLGGVLTIQGIVGGTALPISGTVTANNASVSSTGTAPPGSATYIGGSVTTTAPTYTTGQMSALSLTTTGALRIDGSSVTQPVSGTVTANVGTTNGLALDATLTGGTQRSRITDGTNNAAVKAASTAAAATDPALVVAVSPNNTISTSVADVQATGTLAALNAVVSVAMAGRTTVGFRLAAGTFIGTIVAEASIDGGTTWTPTYFDQTTGIKASSITFAAANTAISSSIVGVGGSSNIRIRVSAFTSGTCAAVVRASTTYDPSLTHAGPIGGPQPPTASQISGFATSAAPTYTTATSNPLSLTTGGALRVDGSATTQPVSGTVAANQSGTWTVQPGNTANTTPWLASINQGGNTATVTASSALKVDGSAVTQPVSGTVTANVGTIAGIATESTLATRLADSTFTGRINTQGQKTMSGSTPVVLASDQTAIPVTGSITATNASVGATETTAPASASLSGGKVATTAPTLTNGQMSALSLTTGGSLRVDNTGSVVTVQQATGSNLNATVSGTVNIGNTPAVTVSSGTVTANLGTIAGVATETTLSTRLADSTFTGRINTLGQKAMTGSTPVVLASDQSSIPVTGTVSIGNSPAVTVTSGNITVAGTVTSNIGTTNGLALDSTLTGGSAKSIVRGGAKGTTTAADVTSSAVDANTQALHVAVTGTPNVAITNVPAVTINSGTITANLGTIAGVATETTLGTRLADSTFTGRINTLGQKAMSASTPVVLASDQSSIPVTGTVSIGNTPAVTVSSGTVTANIGTTNGLSLDATLTSGNQKTILRGGAKGTTTAADLTSSAVDANTQALHVAVTGTPAVTISGTPAVTVSSGTVTANLGTIAGVATETTLSTRLADSTFTGRINTFGQKTMSASTPIVIASDQSAIPITGSITANNASVGTVNATAPGSATFIGGAVSTSAPTYTTGQMSALSLTPTGQLRVDSSVTDTFVTGNLAIMGATVQIMLAGRTSVAAMISGGSWSGNIIVEASVDNASTWFTGRAYNKQTGTVVTNFLANAVIEFMAIGGCTHVRLRAVTMLGMANITLSVTRTLSDDFYPYTTNDGDPSSPLRAFALGLPDTSGGFHHLRSTNTTPVGTEYAIITRNIPSGTQAVSGTVTANLGTIAGVATETTLGTRLADSTFTTRINTLGQKTMANSTPVVIASDQGTIPVSGTITANNPSIGSTGATTPTSAQLSGGAVTTAAPTYTTGQMNALSLTTGGLLRVDASGATQVVSGSGSFTVVQPTAANLNATVTGTVTVSSGTVTANIGTTNGLSLDSTLTGGNQKTIVRGGAKGSTTAADVTSSAVDANTQALHVAVTGTPSVTISGTPSVTISSGAVTANLGTIAGVATESTLSGRLADATFTGRINTQGQKAMSASTPVVLASDQTSIPVTGSGSFTVAQATAANLNATVVGTVTSNIGTTNGLALDATLTGGNQKSVVRGGAKGTTTAADVTSSAVDANTQALHVAVTGTPSVTISGTPTVTANLGTIAGVATESTLSTRLADSTFTGRINTLGQKTMAASTPVVLSSDQSAIPITGSITANNSSVSATGAAPPSSATYIGGSVTTAAPTYTTGQMSALSLTTGGALRVDSSNTTQPVSGTVTVQQATGSNLNAVVTGTVSIGNTPSVTISGTPAVTVTSGTVTANIGTTNGLALDSTLTGGTQKAVVRGGAKGTTSAADVTSSAVDANTQALHVAVTGTPAVTISGTPSVTVSGTATVAGTVTANIGTIAGIATESTLSTRLADATFTGRINTLGQKTMANSTPVVLSSDQSAIPVTGTITANNPSVGSTGATTPTSAQLNGGAVTAVAPTYTTGQMNALSLTTSGGLRVDGSGTTQPISGSVSISGTPSVTVTSGTVTANLGTIAGVATETTLGTRLADLTFTTRINTLGQKTMSGSMPVVIASDQGTIPVSGTITANNPSVGSTGATTPTSAQLSGGAVTTAAPSYTTGQMNALSLTTGGALRVDASGTTQTVQGTGSFTVVQATAANLNATVTGTVSIGNTPSVTISGTPAVTVSSGTVTANIGTTNGLALDATLTGGSQKAILRSGAKGTSVAADVTSSAVDANTQALHVAVTGTPAVTISGTPSVTVSGTATVAGTVTANIGTIAGIATEATQATLLADSTFTGRINTQGQKAMAASTPVVIASDQSAIPVTGTITATNPSVSTTAATAPGSATYVAGNVTTAAPSYTTGQMNALSLTTTGALRTDGSGSTQPVSGTVTANQGTANTAANAWFVKSTDGTNTAAVKASGAVPATTDPALVVTLSPNSSVTPDVTATGNLNALNAAVSIVMAGRYSAGFRLAAGTLIGTIVAEASIDGGTTWTSTYFDQSNGTKASSMVFSSANTVLSSTIIGVGGASNIRIRVSAFTSGTASCTVRGSTVYDPSVTHGGQIGGPTPPTASQIGGSVSASAPSYTNATINAFSLTTAGALRVDSSATTQPVSGSVSISGTPAVTISSGTVTANIGTIAGIATEVTQATLLADSTFTGRINTLGQKTMSNSTPVVLASDQSSIPVSGSVSITGTPAVTITSGTVTVANASIGNTGATTPTQAQLTGGSVSTAAPAYTNGQMSALSLTTGGALRVDASGTTQTVTVSGTATVSGTVTANLGTIAGVATESTLSTRLADSTFTGRINTQGQKTMSASTPIVIASDQSAIPVTGTVTVANSSIGNTGATTPTQAQLTGGAVTTAAPTYTTGQMSALSLTTGGALRVDASGTTQNVNVTNTPAVTVSGTATVSGSVSITGTPAVTISSGSVTASGTVTANQGTANTVANAWFVKNSDGTNTAAVKAASTAAVATDPALVVAISPNNALTTQFATNPTAGLTNVASSATSVTLLAANTARKGAIIFNDSTQDLFCKFGTTASATSFTVKIISGGYYEMPFWYNGIITGIWSSANGNARVTEIS